MTSFIQTNKPFMFTISILAILLALNACSKKAAEPAQDVNPTEILKATLIYNHYTFLKTCRTAV